jgi:hypothetical protein
LFDGDQSRGAREGRPADWRCEGEAEEEGRGTGCPRGGASSACAIATHDCQAGGNCRALRATLAWGGGLCAVGGRARGRPRFLPPPFAGLPSNPAAPAPLCQNTKSQILGNRVGRGGGDRGCGVSERISGIPSILTDHCMHQ